MAKKKEPFVNYTVEEVLAAEACSFVVIAGSDVFDSKGRWVFDKNGAIRQHNKILREVMRIINTGTKAQQKNAKRVLDTLRIEPLRIH